MRDSWILSERNSRLTMETYLVGYNASFKFVEEALHENFEESGQIDVDEVECLLANLIDKVIISFNCSCSLF